MDTEVSTSRPYRSTHWSRNTRKLPCLETPRRESWRHCRRIHKYGSDYRGLYRPRSLDRTHLRSAHGDRRRYAHFAELCLGRRTGKKTFWTNNEKPTTNNYCRYRSRLFLTRIRRIEVLRNCSILDRKSRYHHDSHKSPLYRPGESHQRAKKLAKVTPDSIIPLLGALVERSYRSLQSSGSRFDSGRCLHWHLI